MIEWDSAAYDRKYSNALCKIKLAKESFWGWISDQQGNGAEYSFYVRGLDHWYSTRCSSNEYDPIERLSHPEAELEYSPVRAGWYKCGNVVALITRKMNRSFKIGLSSDSWEMTSFRMADGVMTENVFRQLEPDSPVKNFTAGELHVCSDGVWMHGSRLFYLRDEIGMAKQNRIVLNDPTFTMLVKERLGEEWKISL